MFASDIFPRRRDGLIRPTLTLAALLLALSGCASSRPVIELPPLSSWEVRQEVLSNISSWEFKGRIAVKAGDEGFNGKFRWTQIADEFTATVGGPLGVGTVRIEGNDRTIVLTDKDGVETQLVDPEAELYYRYGWTIPVSSLRYWALGIPDPDRAAEPQVDAEGRLASLAQGNWQVTISRYRESSGQSLPHTLTAINPDTRVRMVIDTWLFFD